nr:histone-lysine N-methyltransferase CLF isoform X1 [Tanacetum cinerariifolium]
MKGNAVTSPMQINNEQKAVPSSDSTGVRASRKKSNGRSLLKRLILRVKMLHQMQEIYLIVKRQKKLVVASHSDSVPSGSLKLQDMGVRSSSLKDNEEASSTSFKGKSLTCRRGRTKNSLVPSGVRSVQAEASDILVKEITSAMPMINSNEKWKKEEFVDDSICRQEAIEFKSRNLMNGMKTCAEVFFAMNSSKKKLSSQGGEGTSFLDGSRIDGNENTGPTLRSTVDVQ